MRREIIQDIQTFGEQALPHLWKDEIGSVFVLTNHMEVYPYSKTVLGCYCWHRKTYLQLQKSGVIFDVRDTDGPLVWFKTDRANLPLILTLGAFKRRPHRNGQWLRSRERLLGHRILPLSVSEHELRLITGLEVQNNSIKSGKTARQSGLSISQLHPIMGKVTHVEYT